MLDDLVVSIAMVVTVAFAWSAFFGSDVLAAWSASGLALFGLLRLVGIVREAISPDH